MRNESAQKVDADSVNDERISSQQELDWDRFSPNAMVALAAVVAVYLSPAYYWSISEEMLVSSLSATNRPYSEVIRYLKERAIWWPQIFNYEVLLDGQVFYRVLPLLRPSLR